MSGVVLGLMGLRFGEVGARGFDKTQNGIQDRPGCKHGLALVIVFAVFST